MSLRQMTLNFSKPVSIDSIDLTQLTLQSAHAPDIDTQYVKFSPLLATVLTQRDSNVIVIYIEKQAYFTIKHLPNLAKSLQTTYIAVSNKFITDTAMPKPNFVLEISNAQALQVINLLIII